MTNHTNLKKPNKSFRGKSLDLFKGIFKRPGVSLKGTKTFQNKMQVIDGKYANNQGAIMHTPTARIMWLLACDLLDRYPHISATQLTNQLSDFFEEFEKTNGGRFN